MADMPAATNQNTPDQKNPGPSLPVIIIGAGIAGLSLALCLARRGIASRIFEQAPVLSEVGAGLQLSPNAMHILGDLGLGEALSHYAVTPEAIVVHDGGGTGKVIARLPLGAAIPQRFGAGYRVIHRADLQSVLLDAALAEPAVTLTLDAHLEEVGQVEDGVEITVGDGTGSSPIRLKGALLIGADGVRSLVRCHVLGGAEARYSGYVAWRATIPTTEAPSLVNYDDMRSTGLWLGPRGHVLHYPLRQGREINIVAIIENDWHSEGWSMPGLPSELMPHFETWSYPLRVLLEKPRTWTKWALCGFNPGGAWTKGRIALVGDAAHATLPFAAQGACMAIEDAAVLSRLLAGAAADGADIPARLAEYERLRKPRTTRLVETAATHGRIYHLRPPLSYARDMTMRMIGGERLVRRMDWIYGWRDKPQTGPQTGP